MTTTERPPTVDEGKLMDFVFKAVTDVGASLNAALVVMGDQLGYYRTLRDHGATTPAELAERTDTEVHYAKEWLNCQAASGFVTYDPGTATYTLPPEQAVALTDESSPVYLQGLFETAYGSVLDAPHIIAAARAGDGYGWGQHNQHVLDGCESFFRPSYAAYLTTSWLPALDGVVQKLTRGCTVADIGCGHGASTLVMARAYPQSVFVGTDHHAGSIETARRRAADAGLAPQVVFEAAAAGDLPGTQYDLVTTFDCLHDMGDPVGAARRIREVIADDGTWMIAEPAAGDRVEDNLNPVGRAYYGFSTLLCTPSSLSQEVGLALGAQAGPERIKEVVTAAGFGKFRIAAQTPFHNVLEVRP